ncbi:MAG: TetR/AcrR family transcriptional regulator [Pseudomonadota bacterium]
MARRSDHSRDEIREMALQAAAAILEQEGAKKLTARRVATAIGYTVGTLYLVFKNLDDMVLQLNARTLDELHDWLTSHNDTKAAPAQQLHALANAYIDYAVRHTDRWNLLFESIAGDDQNLPDWYLQRLSRVFGLIESALVPLTDHQGREAITQAARVLWAGVQGICTLKIRHRLDLAGGQSTEQMAAMLIDNFLAGFVSK